MYKILRPHKDYAAACLDDIVIPSSDWTTHLKRFEAGRSSGNPKSAIRPVTKRQVRTFLGLVGYYRLFLI